MKKVLTHSLITTLRKLFSQSHEMSSTLSMEHAPSEGEDTIIFPMLALHIKDVTMI